MNYLLSLIYLLALLAVLVLPCIAALLVSQRFSGRPKVAIATFAGSLLVFGYLLFLWDASLERPPTLIEDITTGVISGDQVQSIEFARPVEGLFATERKLLQSDQLVGECFRNLTAQLSKDTHQEGIQGRYRPNIILVDHSLTITLKDGSIYLLNFTVYTHSTGDFVSITAWPRLAPPRNDREATLRKLIGPGQLDRKYKSQSFVDFARKYDPWFRH